jgi:hypothetical protein
LDNLSNQLLNELPDDVSLNKARAQVAWLHTKVGGYFSDKIEIRRANPLDRTSPLGIFALADLDADELLITIPKAATIRGIPTTLDSSARSPYWFECDTAHKLTQELKLGSNSTFSSYVEYLLEQSPDQIPSAWSRAGQDLLLEVLGQDENGDGPLPPFDAVNWIQREWIGACGMMEDPLEKFAALMLIQRGWETKLVPIYDMINHHGGAHWVNIHDPRVNHVDDIQVISNRRIQAGEELLFSYTDYADPQYFHEKHGTPEILRDFGFVDSYPRRFHFADEEEDLSVYFETDVKVNNPSNGTTDGAATTTAAGDCLLELKWLEEPNLQGINFLVEQYSRLQALSSKIQEAWTASDIPHQELDMIHQYYDALVVALGMVVETNSYPSTDATTTTTATTTAAITTTATKGVTDGDCVYQEISAT